MSRPDYVEHGKERKMLDLERRVRRLNEAIAAFEEARYFPKLIFPDSISEISITQEEVDFIKNNREKELAEVNKLLKAFKP